VKLVQFAKIKETLQFKQKGVFSYCAFCSKYDDINLYR